MGEERKLACTRTVAVPFKIDDQRPTGGIGGLGGNGSGGGIGLGGFGLGGVGVGVGAGLGFCGTFIASKYSTANVQNSTPDVQIRNQTSNIYSLQPFAVNLVNSSVAADKFLVLLIIENTQAGRPLQFPRRIRMVGVVGEIVFDSIAGTRRFSRVNQHGMIDRKPWITRQITDEQVSAIQRGV